MPSLFACAANYYTHHIACSRMHIIVIAAFDTFGMTITFSYKKRICIVVLRNQILHRLCLDEPYTRIFDQFLYLGQETLIDGNPHLPILLYCNDKRLSL